MRVVNDREEKANRSEIGFTQLLSYVLFTGLTMVTFVFSPVPMILAHLRLQEPWPKVAALLGALVALLALDIPVVPVLISFVFGLFVADGVSRQVPLWKLAANSTLVALVMGLATLFFTAAFDRVDVVGLWVSLVDQFLVQAKQVLQLDARFDWDYLRGILLYEGPFLYVSGTLLAFWLSLGLAAHLKWLPAKHVHSAGRLRKLQLPIWMSFAFVAFFFASNLMVTDNRYLIGGIFRIFTALMVIQGTVVLSKVMAMRNMRPGIRTTVYALFILIGLYALVGLGVFSPWFFRKKKDGFLGGLKTRKMEEAI